MTTPSAALMRRAATTFRATSSSSASAERSVRRWRDSPSARRRASGSSALRASARRACARSSRDAASSASRPTCSTASRSTRCRSSPNVVFMAGRKFGSSGHEDLTWAMNAHVPALVAEAFAGSRIVAYSTGCVYPYVNVHHGGATEATPATPPPGAYANSCVAREGMFQYFSRTRGTPGRIIRLNYAIDMRYGVLHDVATRVLAGEPINLTDRPRQRDLAGRCQCHGAARARSLHRAVEPAQCQRAGDRQRALAGGSVRPAPRQAAGVHRRRSAPKAGWSILPRRCGCSAIRACRSLTLIDWTADWVARGLPSLGKDTHYDTRDGNF